MLKGRVEVYIKRKTYVLVTINADNKERTAASERGCESGDLDGIRTRVSGCRLNS